MSPSPARHKRKEPMKRTDNSGSKLSDSEFETWNAAVRDAAKGKADEEYATRRAMHENGDTAKAIELVEKGPSDKVKDHVSKERPKKMYKPDREKCGTELEAKCDEDCPTWLLSANPFGRAVRTCGRGKGKAKNADTSDRDVGEEEGEEEEEWTLSDEERELAYGCEMREWGVPNSDPYRPVKKEPPSMHNWDM